MSSAMIDPFSRRVVGWSMSLSMTAQLLAYALLMTIWCSGKRECAAAPLSSSSICPSFRRVAPILDGLSVGFVVECAKIDPQRVFTLDTHQHLRGLRSTRPINDDILMVVFTV